jgi:flagellar motor switch protein FliG
MNPSLRKAAILVTALDGAAADQLLDQMGEQQAARVRSAVMELDDVGTAEQETVLAEFFGNSPRPAAADGGVELELTSSPQLPLPRPTSPGEWTPRFEFLNHAGSQELARRLRSEHPQLIAVVVANLAAEKSAELLEIFPRELREEVLDRLGDLEDADAEALAELHRGLQLMFADARRGQPRSGPMHDHLQSILGHLRRNALRERGPATVPMKKEPNGSDGFLPRAAMPAAKIPAAPAPLIVFDQLLSLSAAEFFAVFDEADPRVVMLALAGAPRRLFERYLAQFSTDRALEFERHLEQLRPLRLRDVEAAQRELAILASRRRQAAESAAEKSRRFAAAA